jgi:hypothetical protein
MWQGCRATASGRRSAPTERYDESFLLFSETFFGNNEHMADHVYKKIEIVGSSPNGFEEAVRNALARAQKTVRNMRWFEVTETRGYVDKGKVGEWQVTLKIGFTLDE